MKKMILSLFFLTTLSLSSLATATYEESVANHLMGKWEGAFNHEFLPDLVILEVTIDQVVLQKTYDTVLSPTLLLGEVWLSSNGLTRTFPLHHLFIANAYDSEGNQTPDAASFRLSFAWNEQFETAAFLSSQSQGIFGASFENVTLSSKHSGIYFGKLTKREIK